MADEMPPPTADGWYKIGASMPSSGRLHTQIGARHISVMQVNGKLHCMDSLCFHGGGPLTVGAIEEVAGQLCVICPWHHYKVTIETGEKLYESTKFDPETKKLTPAGWKSVGQRQRTHEVEARSDGIFVKLDASETPIESDRYATGAAPPMGMKPDSQRPPPKAGTRSGTPQGSGASGGGVAGANTTGSRGYAGMPSGQIFQRMAGDGGGK
mmetsp:Transcript_18686/g.44498  ORF Transcript_18686/g.44498 Transcript_18686/m.44498 type:complete len:211 (-) Transcript_18686:64-696(-)